MTSTSSFKQFSLENDMEDVTPDTASMDSIYKHDTEEQRTLLNAKPWSSDPHYFKKIRISAVALIKMVMHARSGGNIEIMGLMQGKIQGDTFIVMDSFALPVEGTETRVNALAEAYEYMVNYTDLSGKVERRENVIGWYHSHPGYGCWLSGIDVSTQLQNQQFQDPWVAVVIDPHRTVSSGKVDIGAFRTYPEKYIPPDAEPSEYQSIPLNKIEDFGVHANQYYSLDVSHFKSALDSKVLDLLWNKYWVATLSQSPLIINADFSSRQIIDLADKIRKTTTTSYSPSPSLTTDMDSSSSSGPIMTPTKPRIGRGRKHESGKFDKIVTDSERISSEEVHGLLTQVLKDRLFNGVRYVRGGQVGRLDQRPSEGVGMEVVDEGQ